jgi:hypothetical protein
MKRLFKFVHQHKLKNIKFLLYANSFIIDDLVQLVFYFRDEIFAFNKQRDPDKI